MSAWKDTYLNWASINLTVVTNAITLNSQEMETGNSIRGELAWEIHRVEWHMEGYGQVVSSEADASDCVAFSLSAIPGLASMQYATDVGTIDSLQIFGSAHITTSGYSKMFDKAPYTHHFLPPMIFARPKITLYGMCLGGNTLFSGGVYVTAKIGYTTVKITDPKLYAEIAETWGPTAG